RVLPPGALPSRTGPRPGWNAHSRLNLLPAGVPLLSILPLPSFANVREGQGPKGSAIPHVTYTVTTMPPVTQSGSVQNLSHIWSGDGFGLRDLRLIERPHVHVALG